MPTAERLVVTAADPERRVVSEVRRRLPYLTSSRDASAVVLAALPDAGTATAHTLLAELREAALGVSPRDTLQKRLANVEQLLGIDLGDLDAVVDLRLGLQAAELVGGPAA